MTPTAWGLLAGLTGLAGYIPYLRDAWRRTSDPDPAAWLIWTVEYAVLLAAQIAQHPPWAALWLAALQLAGTVAVFTLLAARGGWRFGAGRWAMLGCGAAVMAVWPFAHAPGAAMCLALAVEGAGMVLVMLNAYRRPGRETLLTWWAFVEAGLLDLPALGTHAPRLLYAYPVFFIVMGTAVLMAAALGERAAGASAQRQRNLEVAAQRQRYLEAAAQRQRYLEAAQLYLEAAQRQRYLPPDREGPRWPFQAARQPRVGEHAERYRGRAYVPEYRERAR